MVYNYFVVLSRCFLHMDGTDVIDVTVQAMIVTLKIGSPVLLSALGIGLVMALFQTLTQIQEMTLSFIPKILVVFTTLFLFHTFIANVLSTFTLELFDRIVNLK